jgi:hypothetical protein
MVAVHLCGLAAFETIKALLLSISLFSSFGSWVVALFALAFVLCWLAFFHMPNLALVYDVFPWPLKVKYWGSYMIPSAFRV